MRRELGRRWRRRLTAALLAATGALVVACGTASPGTFHPGGTASAGAADPGGSGSAPSGRLADLAWPPFGGNVHIVMPGYLPAQSSEVPAAISAKDFLLAFLYAEYRGGQDDSWTSYVSGTALAGLKSTLAAPDVTSESFTGTIRFSHMRAFADPTTAGTVDVSECFNNADSNNTDLVTGKVIPDTTPADQHYYLNTDVLASHSGHWKVVSVYPVVYYPQAKECKP